MKRCFILFFVTLGSTSPLLADDWPRFLGPNGDGTTNETGILKSWPKEGLKELWTIKLGIGYAPPSVADGKLFHFDRFGNQCRLTCREALTREEKWRAEFPTDYVDSYGFESGPRSCPVIDRGRVFVYGPEGTLACFAVADGKEIWKINTQKKYHFQQNFFGVASAPVVERDTLIAAVGGSPKGRVADFSKVLPDGSCLVGFDVATGEEKWRCGEDLASYSSPIVITMNGKRVGLYFARSGLMGFDPIAGKELFRFPWRARILESVNAANPVVSGNMIFISESYQLGSICLKWDGTTIKEIWSDKEKDRFEQSMMAHWCTPILHNGNLYGCSSRHSPEADFRCVEMSTGNVKWTLPKTRWLTLIKADGHLIALCENGELKLIKLNEAKYEEVAAMEADLPHPSWAPPVLSNGKLYLRGKEKLVCYDITAKK